MIEENLFGGDLLLETGTNEIQLVEFDLRGQSFGVNVDKIRQIIEEPEITSIPEREEIISGIFEFRDKVIPMIDLRRCLLFEQEKKEAGEISPKVIVMDFNGVMNGFLVDNVRRLHRLSWELIEPADMLLEENEDLYVVGIIKFEDRICIMVDFEKIVSTLNSELSIRQFPKIEHNKARALKKIIFAEDSQYVRNEVTSILSTAGFSVEAVNNGAKALALLEAYAAQANEEGTGIEKFVNLVITDIEMPQMDGRYLTRKIKEHPLLKELPVFLFTSMSGMWSQVKAKTIGADGLISKPEIHEMVSKLDEYVLKGAE